MEHNQELVDGLRKLADDISKMKPLKIGYSPAIVISLNSPEDVKPVFEFYGRKYITRRHHGSEWATLDFSSLEQPYKPLCTEFMASRKLDPAEYEAEEREERAIALKSYLSERDQSLVDFIAILASNGISKVQAQSVSEELSKRFKLVPLTDEEKNAITEAENDQE